MLEKQPFVNYTLDEDRDLEKESKYGKPFTIRLNAEERKELDEIKESFDIKSDGTAIKFAAFSFLSVLHRTFHPRYLRYLFKKDRQRLSDFKNFEQ